jgi:histidinol-phosphatase
MNAMGDDLQTALSAARAGAAEGMRWFADLARLRRELKADGTVVTEADRAVEAAVRAVLTADRPADAVLGEEGGQTGDAARRWIIDPIDGTALFVAGDGRWLVLVALEEDGEIVAGVAAVPAQGRIWWASRGGGAWEAPLDDPAAARRLFVSAGPEPDAADRLGVVPMPVADVVGSLLEVMPGLPWRVNPPLLVAAGELDLAVQTSGKIWDFAATSLIVTEAGGVYSTLDGSPRPGTGVSVYARSPELRDKALGYLRG